jgi:serine/threonine protein kinase
LKQNQNAHKVMREIRLLERCAHAHVMKLFEMVNTPTDMFAVCEFVPGGELFEHIVERGRVPSADAKRLFRQLLAGVAYLHGRHIAHRYRSARA